VVISVVVAEAMAVVIFVTETETATVTFEIIGMAPRIAETWTVTGLAGASTATATLIHGTTG
jgi:hypothetical protein